MPFAVFLRGANVGGRGTFRPKEVVAALEALEVRSLGAAGTFSVGRGRSAKAVGEAFAPLVPPACDILVRPLKEVTALVASDPFAGEDPNVQRHVTILASAPTTVPSLPLDAPSKGKWCLRVLRLEGAYALSLRDAPPGKFYPNEIIERSFGVRATTRGWDTVVDLAALAEGSP